MKYRLITTFILLIAVAFYMAGISTAGAAVVVVGAGFEAWFWARVLIKRSSTKMHSAST